MSASTVNPQTDHDAAFRREVWEGFLANIQDLSSVKDKQELLTSIQSFAFHFIKQALPTPGAGNETPVQGLHVLWRMFIETAKVLDKDDLFHDKLVLLLLWTRDFDKLHRDLRPSQSIGITWESYGFADSLQESWEESLLSDTPSQLCNLATFSAKALAAGEFHDCLALTALWYLRETLEVTDEAVTTKLLPAAVVWVDQCRHKLLTLSLFGHSYETHPKTDLSTCGALAQTQGIDESGFSLERWLFWRRRFQHLSHSEDPSVAKDAKKGFMTMINCGRDLDYEVPGEAKFAERLQKAMWEALVESRKESLDGDEIDINVDWVD
ncbi:hypothetical protein ACHAPT_008206 [Fusarium lateritium]